MTWNRVVKKDMREWSKYGLYIRSGKMEKTGKRKNGYKIYSCCVFVYYYIKWMYVKILS